MHTSRAVALMDSYKLRLNAYLGEAVLFCLAICLPPRNGLLQTSMQCVETGEGEAPKFSGLCDRMHAPQYCTANINCYPNGIFVWVLLPTGSVHHSGVPRHSSYSYLDLAAPGAGLLDEGAVLACLQQLLLHSGRGGKPHVSHVVPPGSLSVGPRRGKPKHGQLHGPSSLHSRCRKCMGMGGRACAPELLILLFLPAIIFLLLSPVSSINSARRSKSSVGAT